MQVLTWWCCFCVGSLTDILVQTSIRMSKSLGGRRCAIQGNSQTVKHKKSNTLYSGFKQTLNEREEGCGLLLDII